ncbi:sensor histidine kinase [Foetidibacter luteolus]|uniref:sensor histidine kinase n=1 Tax=Foetidibacter luteolus TaxID=2608880 RepID=UPI00129A1B11|nr:HAMP domain-containing sensor histidine kinase [Foetidibacter luteolus]
MHFETPISSIHDGLSVEGHIFLYNTTGKKVVNSGGANPFTESFLSAIQPEWDKCLQLKNGQAYSFSLPQSFEFYEYDTPFMHARRINVDLLLVIINAADETAGHKALASLLQQLTLFYSNERNEFFDLALHDLQSPVRKLSALSDRLVHHPQGDLSAYLQRIQTVSAELSALTKGLASLYDTHNTINSFEDCNLNTIISELAANELNANGSHITLRMNNMLPVVRGIPGQLKLLFINLLNNAFKFKKNGDNCIVEISSDNVKAGPEMQRYHRVSLKDNGIGFNPEMQEKIFNPFVKLNGKSAYPGAGLGLSICRKIAENHQGYITAVSTGEDGCTIYILLPEKLQA